MDVLNSTGMVAGYTMGTEPSGRSSLVVVAKGTFRLPRDGGPARLHEEQLPLLLADTFTGAPGLSAPVQEADFAPHKPRCDILLLGRAHAPHGKPAAQVPVGLRVGDWTKTFNVVGNRHWEMSRFAARPSAPEPFLAQAISYDVAFGGVDLRHADPARHAAFTANPVGRGWHRHVTRDFVDGAPLPKTEGIDAPVARPDQHYDPMSFGPLGRGWTPRLALAGTYDQHWIDGVFPFLPADFDAAFHQAAPMDQQTAYPRGGEPVTLVNLTPEGRLAFTLPDLTVPVVFTRKDGTHHETLAAADTIVLQPDCDLLTITWRASLPLRKNMLEVPRVVIGRMSRGWWHAQEMGKEWYPSLGELVRQQRQEAAEEE